MKRFLAVLVVLVGLMVGCVGCAGLRLDHTVSFGPPARVQIPGAIEIKPFPMWRRWFALAELCTQTTGDFSSLRFYYVPGWSFHAPYTHYSQDSTGRTISRTDSLMASGLQASDGSGAHDIILPESEIMTRGTVMHEMLHALGFTRHSMQIFVTQCHVETAEELAYETDPVP